MGISNEELEINGYKRVYDYTQYSHENHVNVIPAKDFKHLVNDTFKTITDVLKESYGPYGSTMLLSTSNNETISTKDGYNIYSAMGFSHHYKKKVYLAILKICDRVNRTVGDGTTSCILLADKIFNKIDSVLTNPDANRKALEILSNIETAFQGSIIESTASKNLIRKLNSTSIHSIVSLASNYDEQLTTNLINALSPSYNKNGEVTSIRTVNIDSSNDYSNDTPEYSIEYLPGDYRVNIKFDDGLTWIFRQPVVRRIAIYDHILDQADFDNLKEGLNEIHTNNDGTDHDVLIIAPRMSMSFLDTTYATYMKHCKMMGTPCRIMVSMIDASHAQDEVKDLAAVLNTPLITKVDGPIDHSKLPSAMISIHEGNALCFYDVKPPYEYITKLEVERDNSKSKSLIRKTDYENRISALRMENKDTLLKVHSMSSLESTLIADKLDDCVSIVNSAMKFGVVPNMFAYGKKMIDYMLSNEEADELEISLLNAIKDGLTGLAELIHISKYGNADDFVPNEEYISYDIRMDEKVDIDQLPTSAQYDLEVISAAISIVKYLLTARGMIFDSFLMQMHGDQGRYERS